MDQDKSVLCAAEISITLLERFASILRTYAILFSSVLEIFLSKSAFTLENSFF